MDDRSGRTTADPDEASRFEYFPPYNIALISERKHTSRYIQDEATMKDIDLVSIDLDDEGLSPGTSRAGSRGVQGTLAENPAKDVNY
ncbi:hypothetical protein PMIN01_03526 [Paraphaeosphaeria minitans]|uniref:Uncharacterized protein n=1 Tax=Paraphaeosphaeria minitans TaxID=565426 RepID=A0A9P6GMQ4_9PLEO|nr:hypothetical protein PMIN01_03526 [Paraphaeosphaeria minitans]